MEASRFGTVGAAGTTWAELLLCRPLSPPWPVTTHTASATTVTSAAFGGGAALSTCRACFA